MNLAPEPTIVLRPWPFEACPHCAHEEFQVDTPSLGVVFVCQGCRTPWRYVLGYLQELPADRELPTGGPGIIAA